MDKKLAPMPGQVPVSAAYMTGEDFLQIASTNTLAGAVLTVVGRRMTLDGEILTFSDTHTPNSDGSVKTSTIRIGEGWLLNVAVYVSTGTPTATQTFVMLRIVRGQTGATVELGTLQHGYCTDVIRVAWPGLMSIASAAVTSGTYRSVTGTDPAAGAEVSETVPTGKRWRLIAFAVTAVYSAAGGTRGPRLVIDDGTNVYFESEPLAAIANSATYLVSGGAGLARAGLTINSISLAIPDNLQMKAGHRIRTGTYGLDAGDNYGAPQLYVEEFTE